MTNLVDIRKHKVEPCPFCGMSDYFVYASALFFEKAVACGYCKAQGPIVGIYRYSEPDCFDYPEAINAWNSRSKNAHK